MTRSRTLDALGLLLAAAALTACDSDSPDPAGPGGPEGPDPSAATLQSSELDSGGTGIIVSDGFAPLELEPAVDDDGRIIPDRWTNLSVTVGGRDADVRRIDDRTMEFSVPILPGGTHGVDVASPFAHGSASARVFGVIASEEVVDCPLIYPPDVALIPVGNALFFDTECLAYSAHVQQGVGTVWPAVPHRGFEWLPEGDAQGPGAWISTGPSHRPNHFVARHSGSSEMPELWVWEGGPNPRPVEPLDCFGTADVSRGFLAPAEAGDGACLLLDPGRRQLLRDGELLDAWPSFTAGHFVASDDGWLTVRNSLRLVVFDPAGELVVNTDDFGWIHDVRFAPGGGPLYLASGPASSGEPPRLFVVDRATGDVLRKTTSTGTIWAVAVSDDRLWIARQTEGAGGELVVELLDPETLEIRRSIVVASDLVKLRNFGIWPYHGLVPVLLADANGTRLTFTASPADFAGVWSHVVEVGEIE